MGAWGTKILDNDTANGIYSEFMELYADELPIEEIIATIIDSNQSDIEDYYEKNNFWALWH